MILSFFLLALASPAFAQNPAPPNGPEATVGCGSPKTEFDVTTNNDQHPTAAADAAKAHIYFIQDDKDYIPHPRPTSRFGIDGQWVGATHSNSYFFVTVDPGEHQVCMLWQGMAASGSQHRQPFVLQLTAEAGADYYVSDRNIFSADRNPAPAMVDFEQIDRNRAMFLMSQYALATSTPKTK